MWPDYESNPQPKGHGIDVLTVYQCKALLIHFLPRWLNLFVPYDILNKIMEISIKDVQPLVILVNVLFQLKLLVAANAGKFFIFINFIISSVRVNFIS